MRNLLKLFTATCLGLLFITCNEVETIEAAGDTLVIMKKGPPEDRETVNPAPVQEYVYKIPGSLNNHRFSVQLYETPKRFIFRAALQYEEVKGEDEIDLPNLLQEPQPILKPGKDPLTCIIGFKDNRGAFREYKQVSVVNEELRIKTLRNYGISTTKPVIQD